MPTPAALRAACPSPTPVLGGGGNVSRYEETAACGRAWEGRGGVTGKAHRDFAATARRRCASDSASGYATGGRGAGAGCASEVRAARARYGLRERGARARGVGVEEIKTSLTLLLANGSHSVRLDGELRLASLRVFDCAAVLGRIKAEPRLRRGRSLRSRALIRPPRGGGRLSPFRRLKEAFMLRIYSDILDWIGELAPLVERIKRHNRDLAKQLERASCSVALNTAEGMYARGGHRTAAYGVALKEARESYAALEVAVRLRYIGPLPPALEDRCQKILGTLVRLALPRR